VWDSQYKSVFEYDRSTIYNENMNFKIKRKKFFVLIIIFFVLGLLSRLPIFLYSNSCTFRYNKEFSYLYPFGKKIKGAPDIIVCNDALTKDIFMGHYFIVDLLIFSILIIVLFRLSKYFKK
jgi:hypothetical protein